MGPDRRLRAGGTARVAARRGESPRVRAGLEGQTRARCRDRQPASFCERRQIRAAITEAQDWFAQLAGPTTLTADSHYQLANRLASAFKVASVGVPVVLLYLGFTGDTYFSDHLRDAAHWQQLMHGYLQGVVPPDLRGRVLPHASGGTLTFLIGALPVRAVSQPPSR